MLRSLLAAVLLASAPSGQALEFWVDPTSGVDAPGGGSQATPFRRITYALSQVPPFSTAPLTLWLEPGTYHGEVDPTDGVEQELFPLHLPDGTTIRGTTPTGAVIDHPISQWVMAPNAVFRVGYSGQTVAVTLRDFTVRTAHRFLQAEAWSKATVTLLVQDVEVDFAYRGLVLHAKPGSNAFALVQGGVLDGLELATKLDVKGGAQAALLLDGTELVGRSELVANGYQASLVAVAQNAEFRDALTVGVDVTAKNGGTVDFTATHCLFENLGNQTGVIPPCGFCAAVRDNGLAGSTGATFTFTNCIFWDVKRDVDGWSPASMTMEHCVTSDPASLAASATNFAADPLFVGGNDFHLLPGSPAIDAGSPALVSLVDAEGDPRGHALSGAGPDIGPDEHYARYVYVKSTPTVGDTFEVTTLGLPGATAFLFAGSGTNGQPFGSGVQLAGFLPEPVHQTLLPASGLRTATLAVPANPSLVGGSFALQAAYLEPGPALGLSANAPTAVVEP